MQPMKLESAKGVLRTVRGRLRAFRNAQHDAAAMTALGALPGPFVPWTTFTMSATVILGVLNDIAINDRRCIAECGSGNSTVYIARLLAQRNAGRVFSIEHDSAWAAVTREALRREGLEELAVVIDAPLVDGWYDRKQLPTIEGVDLLVVDGPPAFAREHREARAPALDYFHIFMTEGATVILDDAHRRGEKAVIAGWTARHNRKFTLMTGGYAISAPHVA